MIMTIAFLGIYFSIYAISGMFFKRDDPNFHSALGGTIDIIVLSNELPNSWSSVNSMRNNFYEDTLGNSEASVNDYLKENEETIKNTLSMIKKIIVNISN